MERVRLSVRQLVEFLLQRGDIDARFTGFDRANEGARIHRRLQKAAGEGYAAEFALCAERSAGGIDYRIEGRADGIFFDTDGVPVVDEIKTTAVPAAHITEDLNPCHWAQGMVYAAIYAAQNGLPRMRVRLTYFQIDEEKIFRFVREFSAAALEDFFTGLLEQYAPWARRRLDHNAARDAALQALPFPYPRYRPGQRAMAGEVYRLCQRGGVLLCQAPTGIGKTMSVLFPALRAMGEGETEKVFYLTARTTAQTPAQQALALLRESAPGLPLRSITLAAKEKICLCKNEAGRPVCTPEACPFARGYYDRLRPALDDALNTAPALTREALSALAQAHTVCPFELGLDLSEWCDVVTGDYNYLFDPVVYLRRFFDSPGAYIFLVDEAHNLPDRARAMYSCTFTKSSLTEARRLLPRGDRLKSALTRADKALLACRRSCEALCAAPSAPFASEPAYPAYGDEDKAAQLSLEEVEDEDTAAAPASESEPPLYAAVDTVYRRLPPEEPLRALARLAAPLQDWLEDNTASPAHETLLQLYFSLRDFLRTAERYSDAYVTRLTVRGSELYWELQCLDPAAFVRQQLALGRAAVLFSATLAPPSYYKTVLGCEDARAVALPSPFPTENLGLWQVPLNTRYAHRAESLAPLAEWLAALCGGKVGNYLAFFPSYAYLQQVYEQFCLLHPEIETVVQQSGADDAARAAFLAQFSPAPQRTLLGFGVLGGVFGEGVDLVGSRLIGCAVVGVGLPQVNPRQEMLRRYYAEAGLDGFAYAYRYPGMNKVLQAAGRLIRTDSDRGVLLLLDDRFSRPDTACLLPPHWAHRQRVATPEALRQLVEGFWREESPSAQAAPPG